MFTARPGRGLSQRPASRSAGPEVICLVLQHPRQSGGITRLAGALSPESECVHLAGVGRGMGELALSQWPVSKDSQPQSMNSWKYF